MPDLHFWNETHGITSVLRNNATAEDDVRTTHDRFKWSARIECRTSDRKIVRIHIIILRIILVTDILKLFIFVISSCPQEERFIGESIGTQDHDNLSIFEGVDDTMQPVRIRLAVPVSKDQDTAARLSQCCISGGKAPSLQFLNQSNPIKPSRDFDRAVN